MAIKLGFFRVLIEVHFCCSGGGRGGGGDEEGGERSGGGGGGEAWLRERGLLQ
jgi:hypothetical protein